MTANASRIFLPGEPRLWPRSRLRARRVMEPSKGSRPASPAHHLAEDAGRAERLVGALAKLRLLGPGLGSLRIAAAVDLDSYAVGGRFGDVDGGDVGRLEDRPRPSE